MILPHIKKKFIKNPGDGRHRLSSENEREFESITIMQEDSDETLAGEITFSLGTHSFTLDLEAGERFIDLQGRLPFVDAELVGVDPEADFMIVLV